MFFNTFLNTYFNTYFNLDVINYESFVEPLRGSQIIKHFLF